MYFILAEILAEIFICFRYGDATWSHRKGQYDLRGDRGAFIAVAARAAVTYAAPWRYGNKYW